MGIGLFSGESGLEVAAQWQATPKGPTNILVIPRNGVILTSGSDLDQAAVSSGDRRLPWPPVFLAAVKRMFNGWGKRDLKEVYAKVLPGNYGSQGSLAQYGFRGSEFGGPFLYPGPVPVGTRPMYDNIVPTVYGLRVIDYDSQSQLAELNIIQTIPVAPVDFNPGGAASIAEQVS
jgi:hypothetical protein